MFRRDTFKYGNNQNNRNVSRVKIKKMIFATVDKSPHCIQMHYIENEIRKAMNIDDIEFIHYVAVNNKLIKVSNETIIKTKFRN